MPAQDPVPAVLSVRSEPIPQTSAELYIDLMKKILTRALTANGIERHTIRPNGPKSKVMHRFNTVLARQGLEVVRRTPPLAGDDYLEPVPRSRIGDAETLLGIRQLDHMQRCIVDVLGRNVPGDLLEAGVWRGGMTIFMRAVLKAYQIGDRKVWVADSFAGFPEIDRRYETSDFQSGEFAVSLEDVRNNFARYGLLDEQVQFLKGFFSETLPTAPVRQLAILRADADLYESTMDILRNLYSALSIGGYAIFDDYKNMADCRRAVHDFRSERGIAEEICSLDGHAVYWRKES
jgi:O-methyltransferase